MADSFTMGLTTDQAGQMLGISGEMFEDIVTDHPWLKPFWMGKGKRKLKRWPREGVEALRYVLLNSQPEGPSREKTPPESTAEGG